MQTRNSLNPQPWWTQLYSLLYIELTNYRWSWRGMLITGALAPVLSILGFGAFARASGPQALAYVLTGNLVLSMMFGNMNAIQGHVSFLRFRGTLEYFATLPVRRSNLVLAMVLSFLLLSLPSLLVTMALGAFVLGVPVHLSPWLLLVIPLAAIPLSGIGALVGASVRVPEYGDSITLILTLILTGLGPVIIPPDRLPAWMIFLGHFSPATYAASAFRQAVLGPVTGQIWLDLAVLLVVGLVVFALVNHRLDWRTEI